MFKAIISNGDEEDMLSLFMILFLSPLNSFSFSLNNVL